eukprot:GHRR01023291.1.p1 GENE.GHRR01023291.1~~GHRR01023291.1.p1  ORF type:complete len:455 (+),score=135.96 GHRR01023291.1:291-1655(+)
MSTRCKCSGGNHSRRMQLWPLLEGLARHGVRAVVFDTGKRSVGGRAATRTTADASIHSNWINNHLSKAQLVFDHAAQCFTATDPWFNQQVTAWLASGVVQQWQGPVGTLKAGGIFQQFGADQQLYVAAGGMRRLAQHMADQVVTASKGAIQVVRPMWVSRMVAVHAAGGWQLTGNNKGQGTFGAVVIAHNGKCANRLVGPSGAPAIAKQLMKLRLSAVWVTMVAFEQPVRVPARMEGAFIQGSHVLSWAGNNTAKLQLLHPAPYSQLQCWTLISTNSYGQANKVPQEKVPAYVANKVAHEMIAEFSRVLGSNVQLPKPVFTRCQLWGAALPLNAPKVSCILDPASRVGICGDWLTGASIQSAVLSGWALADRLAALQGRTTAEAANLAIGLDTPFQPLSEVEIGEFPGLLKVPVASGSANGAAARGRADIGSVDCGSNGGKLVAGSRSTARPQQ